MALHVALQDIADHTFAQPPAPSADDVAVVQVLEILGVALGDQVIQRRMDKIGPRRRQDPAASGGARVACVDQDADLPTKYLANERVFLDTQL